MIEILAPTFTYQEYGSSKKYRTDTIEEGKASHQIFVRIKNGTDIDIKGHVWVDIVLPSGDEKEKEKLCKIKAGKALVKKMRGFKTTEQGRYTIGIAMGSTGKFFDYQVGKPTSYGTLYGKVVYANGKPAKRVTLLFPDVNPAKHIKTDKNGEYAIRLPHGTHRVIAKKIIMGVCVWDEYLGTVDIADLLLMDFQLGR